MTAVRLSARLGAIGGAVVLAGALGVTPALASSGHHHHASPHHSSVVATGLNNPRNLAFGPGGALYVAESGMGGSSTGNAGPCFLASAGSNVCYGTTGSITEILRGRQHRVLTGLPSLADTDGSEATGPSDIVLTGRQGYAISMGQGAAPADRDTLLPRKGQALGTIIEGRFKGWGHHRWAHGGWRVVADVSANEAAHNPDGGALDTNPSSIAKSRSGYVVADAGGNDVVEANRWGRFHTLAAFPTRLEPAPPSGDDVPMQAVPTAAVRGPDGAWYVSQLTGFPFPVGGASIWRVVPGHKPTQFATGLTNVTDLAFARDGSLYAVEIASNGLLGPQIGSVVHIPRHRGTTSTFTTVKGGLNAPYGIALHGRDAYVTTGSSTAGDGQVLRIPLH